MQCNHPKKKKKCLMEIKSPLKALGERKSLYKYQDEQPNVNKSGQNPGGVRRHYGKCRKKRSEDSKKGCGVGGNISEKGK